MTGLRRAGEVDAVVGTKRDVADALQSCRCRAHVAVEHTQGRGRPIVRRKTSAELGRSVGPDAGTTRRAPFCSISVPVGQPRPNRLIPPVHKAPEHGLSQSEAACQAPFRPANTSLLSRVGHQSRSRDGIAVSKPLRQSRGYKRPVSTPITVFFVSSGKCCTRRYVFGH